MTILLFNMFQDITQGPGTESYTNYLLEILIMLLVAFILGYLLRLLIGRKYRVQARELAEAKASLETELDACRKKRNELEENLNKARYELDKAREDMATYRARLADLDIKLKACNEQLTNAGIAFGAGIASQSQKQKSSDKDQIDYNKAFSADNLQVIEGIGPKIEGALKEAGINNWGELADAKADRLKEILAAKNYRLNDPTTWPKQASLARDGKWAELVSLQKDLDGGSGVMTDGATASKAEKLAARILGITLYKPDDLKVVEGIGPKIESLLKSKGIHNWKDLAKASVDQLQSILGEAGNNFKLAKPDTWPKQAQLAAEGKWKELDEYQEFLLGGVDPSA